MKVKRTPWYLIFWLLSVCFALPSFAETSFAESPSAAPDNWEFVIAPYALLPNISGDASLGRIDGADVEVDAGDILESLEFAAMVQVEAHHTSGFGALVNYAFMNLGEDATGPLGFTEVDVEIFQGILEGYGTYRSKFATSVLDVYGGVRWWDIKIDMDATTPLGSRSFERDEGWVDPVVGVRWIPEIAADWRLILQSDVGGFGVASNFSWNIQAGVAWKASEDVSVILMYRALGVDYDTGTQGTRDYFEYDTITQGPIFGVVFRL